MAISDLTKMLFKRFVLDENASDLHISPNDKPRMRIKDKLERIDDEAVLTPMDTLTFVEDLFKIKYEDNYRVFFEEYLNGKEKDGEIVRKGEYDMAIVIPGTSYRCRVNILRTMGNYGAVLRKIPNKIPIMENLGFFKQHEQKIKEMARRKEGLILVTGQTGSGKSTTLAAIINDLNEKEKKKIITIEDPVEFVHKNKLSDIVQREVGVAADTMSFYSGLKAALREDPDIILVGEIRDEETALAAMQAAQTGHIVFATLHTNSAPETITRIIDMFPPEKERSIKTTLASSLRMIISQKLAPSLDGRRKLIYEILVNNTEIQNQIIKEKFDDSHVRRSMNSGRSTDDRMIPMEYCLLERIKRKEISEKTAIEYANYKDEMKQLIEKNISLVASGNSSSFETLSGESNLPKGWF